jgi:exopolysaccharide biosynthesis polyprenyl glycosylphosphotransferase
VRIKCLIDRSLGVLALVLLSPILLAVAVAVRVESPGPVLFRQLRTGKDGRQFTMVKFRTMVRDAAERRPALLEQNDGDGVLFKLRDDPRVTPLGRMLRRYSLDELPQIFNVVAGDMSLVGPRPPLPDEVDLYEKHVHRRFAVKPGMTGLWQVSGRADLTWAESVQLDLRYVDNWSLLLDLQILGRTLGTVLRGQGAY